MVVPHDERVRSFSVVPWPEIEDFYEDLLTGGVDFIAPMLALTRSIRVEGRASRLAAHTSMYDLVVTTTPVSSQPDWLRISLLPRDRVRIAHDASTGPGDSIERAASDLLPLFWRFTIEKWGIRPDRDSR